jgi:hypothetical protein
MSFSDYEKKQIEKVVEKEMKNFLNSTKAHDLVLKVIEKEIGTKNINEKIVDLSTKVVVELFKTLWQRKSFWENAIKNVK